MKLANSLNTFLKFSLTIAAGVVLSACSKSVDYYIENPGEREIVFGKCILSGKGFDSGDCKAAHEAETRTQKVHEEKMRIARQARASEEALEKEKKAAAEAAEKARLKSEFEAASEKFKAIELAEREKFDKAEALLAKYTHAELQSRLTRFASALNQGDTSTAAALMETTAMQVQPLVQQMQALGGYTSAKIAKFSLDQPVFQFSLKKGWGEYAIPTGYDLNSKNSRLTLAVQLISHVDKHGLVRCSAFEYRLGVDSATGQVSGQVIGPNQTVCHS